MDPLFESRPKYSIPTIKIIMCSENEAGPRVLQSSVQQHAPCKNSKQVRQDQNTLRDIGIDLGNSCECVSSLSTGFKQSRSDLVFELFSLPDNSIFGLLFWLNTLLKVSQHMRVHSNFSNDVLTTNYLPIN